MRRKALTDYTFSDGTFVAKGNWVCFPQAAMMRDRQYWEDADSFSGFRFASVQAVEKIAIPAADRNTTQTGNSETTYCGSDRGSGGGEKFTDINHKRLIWGGGDKTW